MRPLGKDDPEQIGRFRLIGLLGSGGMGRVYLGRSADGRTVAVKAARPELADDRGFRIRFAREVAAARRVGGPFVAPVVDAAPDDDAPWMATDYVPGVSLTDAVHDCGRLPEPAVLLLTAGLLQALSAVHAHGLVHRDLKPSNILLTAEGPRVIDFGIAHSAADTALTMTGTTLGTPGFMAPEQLVTSGPKITGAADVFALGGVISYAATGAGPYGAADPTVLMYRTVHEEPQLAELPGRLRELAAACLAKDPGARPSLARLGEWVGPAGPYGDWLPEPVTVQLHRLSTEIMRDPRSPGAEPARPPATEPEGPPAVSPTPPPLGQFGPPTPFVDGPYAPPLQQTVTPPAPRGPSRRRVLAALSVTGVVAGGGAVAWALRPDGEGTTGGTGGKDPGGGGKTGTGGTTPPASGSLSDRLPKAIRDRGSLTVGADMSYPPMESMEEGKPTGIDVDVADALGRELDIEVRFKTAAFESLLGALSTGTYDLVMSAMVDTEDRQKGLAEGKKTGPGVDFVDYFRAGLSLVVRKGNPDGITRPEDLSGKSVSVQYGTVSQDYLRELDKKLPEGLRIREHETSFDMYADVAKGRSAACLDEYPLAAYTAATHSDGTSLELATSRPIEPVALYGIAVAKSAPDLRDAVQAALARLLKSGEYTRILKKWSVPDGAVRKAEINAGR
ncbi:bifunctional serine/threonine-protein kinase/transporter substrate-binding domain-containing protein [Streptomyces sp. NBC_01304]|uniref:bifunctional serine/threonine-protein kinase/transporter substrate-binding domain-containing protein n=1 Tax=Streptomyces sp. NBC_01304 TaxID=2903818 RepID=UPI002E0D2830